MFQTGGVRSVGPLIQFNVSYRVVVALGCHKQG
jgi:hypothetical protein